MVQQTLGPGPYLTLAGVLMAGVNGIVESRELNIQDYKLSPALMGEEERAKLGIKERLPLSRADACSRFEESAHSGSYFWERVQKEVSNSPKGMNPSPSSFFERLTLTCNLTDIVSRVYGRTQ